MGNKTVFIGIPAYNEEKNILSLLESLLSQKGDNFTLKQIVVTCDGSTDKTPTLVREFSQQHPTVTVLSDTERKGKSGRLNDLYKLFTTDVFISIDADVVIKDTSVVRDIVATFDDPAVGLVSITDAPLPGKSFIGKCCEAYEDFWTEAVNRVNNGISVHAHPGHVSAGSRDFLKKVSIPKEIVADDHYLYFECMRQGFTFKSSRKTMGYIRVPETFTDFMRQSTRFYSSAEQIKTYFGAEAETAYAIPMKSKLAAYYIIGRERPVYLIGALVLQLIQRIFGSYFIQKNEARLWTTISSSK